MLTLPIICFWASAAIVLYTFVLYPLLIALAAGFWNSPLNLSGPPPSGISLVLSARNEQKQIARRLRELVELLRTVDLPNEIVVISDGSTDDTATIARTFCQDNVRVVEWSQNRGKAAAINHAVSLARHDVILLADARQKWAEDTVTQLLECFQDPQVGAVSGQLLLSTPSGVLAGVGLYWKFEKWLRGKEALLHSQIGVTGAICAVRRELFRPLPQGIILDDVYWPMQVVMQGRRVVYQPKATALDELPEHSVDELRRKLRTLVGNFQLLSTCPQLLVPGKNPVFWQLVSHKVLRLVAPWALLLMILSSGFVPTPFYRTMFILLAVGLTIATIGLISPLGKRHQLFSAAGSFLLLQLAAWLAFWYWILGRSNSVWTSTPSPASTADQL